MILSFYVNIKKLPCKAWHDYLQSMLSLPTKLTQVATASKNILDCSLSRDSNTVLFGIVINGYSRTFITGNVEDRREYFCIHFKHKLLLFICRMMLIQNRKCQIHTKIIMKTHITLWRGLHLGQS